MDRSLVESAAPLASGDGEVRLNAGARTGSLTLDDGASCWVVPIEHGATGTPRADPPADSANDASDTVVLRAAPEAGTALLSSPPPPGYTDPFAAAGMGATTIGSPPADAGRHLAVRRFVQLLRHAANGTDAAPVPSPPEAAHGTHDAAVGHFVHLELDGLDHRIYCETAEQGIRLRDQIVTSRCAVHLLTGEYDFPTVGRTQEAAAQIVGSTFAALDASATCRCPRITTA